MQRHRLGSFYAGIAALAFALGVALGGLVSPALAQGAGTITGTVIDEATGAPIAGAQITVEGTPYGAIADDSGQFTITGVPAGTYTVAASTFGYITAQSSVTVADTGSAQVALRLAEDPEAGEVIEIIGSRLPRSVTDTPVAVDLIDSEVIERSGQSETNQILATVAPSYNATHQTIADGSDHVNPASLRGLGPGQVLVLVNGKRRHPAALIHVNGTFGRGTVGVDLNAIPTLAVKRIEVLRDGASAQYGSDAIAGVINIVLKDYTELLDARLHTGITAFGDGLEFKAGGNYGIRLGADGFVNLTGEFLQRFKTDRSGPWEGNFFPGVSDYDETTQMLEQRGLSREDVSMDIGQSQATVGNLVLNSSLPVGAGEVYAFGTFAYRDGQAAGFYRRPEQSDRYIPEIYPDGFLPEIHVKSVDWEGAAGYRQEVAGWNVDFGANHGGNSFLYYVENSLNASIGPSSQTSFKAGGPLFNQTSFNLDVARPLYLPGIKQIGFASGAEFRIENYQLRAGERESWLCGPLAQAADPADRKACGAQVFPGFQPETEVSEFRNSFGAYAALESALTDAFSLDLAGRFEYFDDFGATVNGKLAARLDVTDALAIRGAVSTGFRAPALHQVWFSTISTQFVDVMDPNTGETTLEPRQVLTANNGSEVARSFGIPELEEETSLNVSAGLAAKPMENLTFTLDAYRIRIDDRIVLTSRFSDSDPAIGEIVTTLLDGAQGNPSQAQFFTNAVDTMTRGIDIVADYSLPMQIAGGNVGFTGSANFTRTVVERVNIPQGVADKFAEGDLDAVRTVIFNREEENRLEDSLPLAKGTFSLRYGRGPLDALLRTNYYGSVQYKPTNPALDETFSPKVTFDLDLGYKLSGGFKVSVGGTNLFNTMPDEHRIAANRFNEQFVYSRRVSQFGMNGGFYYLRLQYLL
ncbi:TonB-dependent receptor [Haliangium sp.]|uniref:TonB-dependent receptor n=1 Tax=Haliangium sp. TaxID=2663208 RepID=UPI003D09D788